MFYKNKMRIYTILAVFGIMFVAQNSQADDFGDRFYNQTPVGMADYTAPKEEISDIAMDKAAQELQDIMPAAGDENQEDASLHNNDNNSLDNEEINED